MKSATCGTIPFELPVLRLFMSHCDTEAHMKPLMAGVALDHWVHCWHPAAAVYWYVDSRYYVVACVSTILDGWEHMGNVRSLGIASDGSSSALHESYIVYFPGLSPSQSVVVYAIASGLGTRLHMLL